MYVVSASAAGESELESNFGLHVWDPNTGTLLASFKHANVTLHGLSFYGRDHLVGAQAHRATIHIWDYRKEVPQIRCTPPERVGAVAASPSGVYFAAAGATSGKVYLWQISNGRLVRSFDAHYRTVTSLCFSDCGSLLYTAGEDALVKCWTVSELVAVRLVAVNPLGGGFEDQDAKPFHTFTNPTLPVTALKCGRGGFAARLYSASLDRTVKIYELTGAREMISSFAFPSAVHSLAIDLSERYVFAGLADGTIHRVILSPTANKLALATTHQPAADAPLIFYGHKNSVTALSVTPDEMLLISGSADGSCKVWHIGSAQMLVNFDKHKGEIVDLKVFLSPSENNFAIADADEFAADNAAFASPVAPLQKYATDSAAVASNQASSSAGEDGNGNASQQKQQIPLDGDVVVNLYANKPETRKKRTKLTTRESERLREMYWSALAASSKGAQDEELIRKADEFLKSADTGKPKEKELAAQVARLQAQLEAAKETNIRWQEINNQMYRSVFSTLRNQNQAAPLSSPPSSNLSQ